MVIINQMDTPKIMGRQDYQWFYDTSECLVWLDRKGNPIPLSHLLNTHIEAIDPSRLWNSIQTQNKVHKQNLTALGTGPTNITTIDANMPVMMTPTSPIMEHHVEVRHLEGSSIVTVKELLDNPPHRTGDDAVCIESSHIPVYPQQVNSFCWE